MAAVFLLSACDWGKLAVGAISTPTSGPESVSNVSIHGDYAYLAASAAGIETLGLTDGSHRKVLPAAPADRIDDVAICGDLLFALDATAPGYLTVYRIQGSGELLRVGAPVAVPVGPFSGVSAAAGHVIVSGGTSQLTLRNFNAQGELGQQTATADFGRGQPDVVISAEGSRALVSTHIQGPRFGITLAQIRQQPLALIETGYVPLDAAGFTDGAFKPANFPLQAVFDGSYALIAHGGGLSVVAIDPKSKPTLVTTLPLPFKATAIAFDDKRHLAYVVGVNPMPVIVEVDMTSPTSPRLLAQHALPANGSPTAVALGSHHLVVAMQAGGVYAESR